MQGKDVMLYFGEQGADKEHADSEGATPLLCVCSLALLPAAHQQPVQEELCAFSGGAGGRHVAIHGMWRDMLGLRGPYSRGGSGGLPSLT